MTIHRMSGSSNDSSLKRQFIERQGIVSSKRQLVEKTVHQDCQTNKLNDSLTKQQFTEGRLIDTKIHRRIVYWNENWSNKSFCKTQFAKQDFWWICTSTSSLPTTIGCKLMCRISCVCIVWYSANRFYDQGSSAGLKTNTLVSMRGMHVVSRIRQLCASCLVNVFSMLGFFNFCELEGKHR